MNAKCRLRNSLILIVLLGQMLSPVVSYAGPAGQQPTPESRAQALLDELTPEERVGQLFLISFEGNQITEDSPINNLIANHHIGGVILKGKNGNFTGPEDTIHGAWQLTQALQTVEWISSQDQLLDPLTNEPFSPNFIPLFIGISQNGDGAPSDQLFTGLTPLPSQMAIGATWNPDLAFQVGDVLGQELEILGINLLLGPSLDVLEDPRSERAGDPGINSFGGDPYWVGLMGQSFIAGVHSGSDNRIALVGKHFPGLSGADRPPEEEIPTVRKSLEQLTEVELAPFFAITGNAPGEEYTVDGLLLAHAKYEGFQGNIRPSTRPISFDPQAVEQLLSIEQFAAWRANGGLIISEELGTRAIRRFEDPTEFIFNARLVALNAFLAGNDLLNLGDFVSNEDPDSFTTILRTLDFFSLKYREDVAFAQRVDEAVLKILTKKFEMYESFRLDNILTGEDRLNLVGGSDQVSFEVGRQAATLFSPVAANLDTILPSPPGLSERIVIISDTYPVQQCPTCPAVPVLGLQSLEQIVVRLYGPEAGGQIVRQNLKSYSFEDLATMLDGGNGSNQLLIDLRGAEWVVFLMLDEDVNRSASLSLSRMLSERPDLIQQKKSVVFALDAPYFLDATDISNISVYYGLYSKQPQFIEVAARLLFKELTAPGSSPVSVRSVGYNLTTALSPDPNRTYVLAVRLANEDEAEVAPTPEEGEPVPEIVEEYFVGDPIILTTGKILDHNGHPVPDNTPTKFILTTTNAEGNTSQREINTVTLKGVARTSFVLDTPGTLTVQASSGTPEALSTTISLDVVDQGDGGGGVIVVVTETPSPDDSPFPIPTLEPSQPININDTLKEGRLHPVHWFLLVLVAAFASLFAYQVGAVAGQVRWGVRWALTSFIGGLLVISYLAFSLGGSEDFIMKYTLWGIVIGTIIGDLVGWGLGVLWRNFGK